jgi:CheY-like chemotaxis protein
MRPVRIIIVFIFQPKRAMKKFRILIVDDNGSLRQALKQSLQKSFPTAAIDEVADGAEVLRKVDAFVPDLIFMDIKLPGISRRVWVYLSS